MEDCSKEEIYTRDHLLIQWFCEYFRITHVDIEKYYEDWIGWLNEREEKNG